MNTQSLGNLREVREDELELIRLWRNHPDIRKYMYTRHAIEKEEHLLWWKQIKNSEKDKFLIYEYEGLSMGVIGFYKIDKKNKNAYWTFHAKPGAVMGTGMRMEFLAIEYAFTHLYLHKLVCEVLDFNVNVIKLHKRFFFSVEGILKEQHRYDEKFIDIFSLGLIHSLWQEKKIELFELIKKLSR